jgi:NAD+ diphosphatase
MGPADPFPPSPLDRAGALRTDEAALAELWQRAGAQRIAVRDGHIGIAAGGAATEVALPPGAVAAPPSQRVLLGIDPQQRPWWLVLGAPPDAAVRWVGLRELGPQLSALQLDAVMTAVAMESWHARHRYCPVCGRPTEATAAGWLRRCSADGTEHYPRTDPAIIVVVIDSDDRALLGRQTRWPERWRSALAGFVEPGERAESAVQREVAEEVGVRLDAIQYVSSQPWPFPGSLMLGFHAWTSDPTIVVDGVEIAEAAFYSRDDLAAAAAAGTIQLPPSISIARGLIERWYGSPIPGSWLRS